MLRKLILAAMVLLSGCSSLAPDTQAPNLAVVERSLIVPGPIPCIDVLGAAKYPKVLRALPNTFAIGAFAKTFGDFFPVAKKELENGRRWIRVNLLWSDTHTYGKADLKFIKKESKRYNILCTAFPNALIELAAFTEHNLAKPDEFLAVVKANAPNCGKPVNSVWKGSFTKNPAYKNEVHGSHQAPNIPGVSYNWSDDGRNSVDTDFPKSLKTHARADMACAWHPRNNGKWSMKDSTPRPQRKAWPSTEMLESQAYLFTDRGDTSIPKGWLIKSHSERHGLADQKGDKLLVIAPVKANAAILKKQGKKVGTLPHYGPYDGCANCQRYYAPKMGYQYGPNLDLFLDNKKYGVINGGFRLGNYRD